MIPALNRLEVQGDLGTEAISRNAKAEKFHPNGSLREKPAFPIRRNPTLLPIPQGSIRIRPVRESCQSTLFTPDLTSTKNPEIQRAAACAFIHTPNIVVLQYVINMFSATLLTHYLIKSRSSPEIISGFNPRPFGFPFAHAQGMAQGKLFTSVFASLRRTSRDARSLASLSRS